MRRETLLLVGDMRGAVVVTSVLFLQIFLLDGPGMIDGATLKTGRSMRRETILLVGGMRGAIVMTSLLFLQIFLLALPKFGFVATTVGYANHTIFTRIITYKSISKNT